MIKPVPHVAAMAAYALADLGETGTISLAQNESAFPASPAALAAGRAVMGQMPLYPDPDWTELRTAISEVHRIDPAKILCGAGSMELIGCLIRAYAGPGDRVLGTDYGYAFVSSAVAQAQAEYVKAHEVDLTVSVDEILRAVTPATKIVFVCNPGNPTGTRISNADIIRLRQSLPDNVLLVVDQAYGEFSDVADDPAGIFALVERGDTVVMRTFSKAYGLASARAGWGYFPPEIAREIRKLLNPNNISAPSQAIATAAMRDQDHMQTTVMQTALLRDGFRDAVCALGVTVPQSHTNFVLLRFDSPETVQEIDVALRGDKLLMRTMAGYDLPECLRATICSQSVMDRAFTAIKGVIR